MKSIMLTLLDVFYDTSSCGSAIATRSHRVVTQGNTFTTFTHHFDQNIKHTVSLWPFR